MNDLPQDTYTYTNIKCKTNKISETATSNSKLTFFKRIFNIFLFIEKIIVWIVKKIYSILSRCSIVSQFIIILLPFSIICILFIFYFHVYFYQSLFLFNFYKGFKEEFLDNYITEIDDLHSDLDSFVTKENYIDVENQLFFEVYYKELASIGTLDNPNKKIFPDINRISETLYLGMDKKEEENNGDDTFTIPKEIAKENIDDRNVDSLGEFAKLYFYMFPIIRYGDFSYNVVINQSFFIAYEFDKDNNNIKNNELFFMFPRKTSSFNNNTNFIINDYYINPQVSKSSFSHTTLIDNSFYKENWFMDQDYKFRELDNKTEEGFFQLSLAHLNNEYIGNINKSIIISSQQYIQSNNKHYIINIIFFLGQMNLVKDSIEYSNFIIKRNAMTDENIIEKYSDNETFSILKSDIIEFSLTTLDFEYFHYGLYDKYYSFLKNGISIDSFNLNYLYNPLQFYSTVGTLKVDLKYLSVLYLYKTLFQSFNYEFIQKERQEVHLFKFDDEKVKNICSKIDFNVYKDYLEESGINCWNKENKNYYNENNYQSISLIDVYSVYPHCSCLPLFCLSNYESLENDDEFTNFEFSSKINLPNKCQYSFISYENNKRSNEIGLSTSSRIFESLKDNFDNSNYEYVKFKVDELTQLPDFFLLIITQVKSNNGLYDYQFFSYMQLIEIIFIVLSITVISFIICMIIMYLNLRKFSLIIKEFKKKFELYVYNLETDKIINLNKEEKKKNYEYDNNNENVPLLQNENKDISCVNDNTLLEYLFSIFCKHYKISRKDIENYFLEEKHETKNKIKLKKMIEKNELFKLLSLFSILAPIFKLDLSLDYKMYRYSKIMKKYNKYFSQVTNKNKQQTRLTQNILYELLSTENISDYGLIVNLNFKYISNIKAEIKENSIQNALIKNVLNRMKGKNQDLNESENNNFNDEFLILNDDEKQNIKLILKRKNELVELFKNKFESDNYININKIESSFNFFLINSYYKYLNQIILEGNND